MKFDLVKATDEHMCRPRVSFPNSGFFYPSEASVTWTDSFGEERVAGTCLRAAYLRLTSKAIPIQTTPYAEWIFALGKQVENILVEQWKQMGIWVGNSLKFYDQIRKISGELDVIIQDPTTKEFICCEIKSFYGYQATRDLIGNKKVSPSPKTSQLLQTLIYADQCKNIISYCKMIYYARDSAARTQFDIRLIKNENGTHSPSVNGIIDPRFTLEDIYSRFKLLEHYIQTDILPPPDYEAEFSPEKVEKRKKLGEVSKTAYENWQKNPSKSPIGDWQCSYCSFRKFCWGSNTQASNEIDSTE